MVGHVGWGVGVAIALAGCAGVTVGPPPGALPASVQEAKVALGGGGGSACPVDVLAALDNEIQGIADSAARNDLALRLRSLRLDVSTSQSGEAYALRAFRASLSRAVQDQRIDPEQGQRIGTLLACWPPDAPLAAR